MIVKSLSSLLEKQDESSVLDVLGQFEVRRNNEVKKFIHSQAIAYEKSNNSRSYLFFTDDGVLVGFIAIAITIVDVSNLSKTLSRKILGYGHLQSRSTPGFLIGQVAKNCSVPDSSGRIMIDWAIDKFRRLNSEIGGRVVALDCNDDLVPYYESFGFVKVNKTDYNQMILFLK